MWLYLSGVSFWITLFFILFKLNGSNLKVTRNLISSVQCFGVIISYLTSFSPFMLYYWSVTYYILDLGVEINQMKKLYNFGMIFHHLITIFVLRYLQKEETQLIVFNSFFLVEFSNIFLYLVYHLRLVKYSRLGVMSVLVLFEIIFYGFFRLILGLRIIYYLVLKSLTYERDYVILLVGSIGIYIISLIWMRKMCKHFFS